MIARCLVCGNDLGAGCVWCVDCDTPHHRECFIYNGRCAIFGCTGMHFRLARGGGPAVTWLEVRDPGGALVPRGYVVDFTSGREGLSLRGGLVLLAFAPVVWFSLPGWLPAAAVAAVGVLALFVRAGLDDYRIVDAKTRTIWLHRKLFGSVSVRPELRFDQGKHLVVLGRRVRVDHEQYRRRSLLIPEPPPQWGRVWSVVLVLKDRSLIPLTDEVRIKDSEAIEHGPDRPPGELASTARRLSQLMELEWRVHLE